MGDALGGAGSLISGLGGFAGLAGNLIGMGNAQDATQNSTQAIKDATAAQLTAIAEQRRFVFDNLDPSVINAEAASADAKRALARLALQGLIDPQLLSQRYESQKKISEDLAKIGASPSDEVAALTTAEALKGVPGMTEVQSKLVDAALKDLSLGATLPPDVQAELVRSGLEQSGMVTGGTAGARGVGGTMLRTILGSAGVNLQMARQKQAADLATSASNLEAQRQNILQGLFPKLQAQQLANLKASSDVLKQSNEMLPQIGLSGSDVANIWLARVGATNTLTQNAANASSAGIMALANAMNEGLGKETGFTTGAINSIPMIGSGLSSLGNTYNGWFNSASPSSSSSPNMPSGSPDLAWLNQNYA